MDRKAMIEKIKGYKRAQRKNMGLGSSQKKCTTCPVCGTHGTYDFHGRWKRCIMCGYSTYWEKKISYIKHELSRGYDSFPKDTLKATCEYIDFRRECVNKLEE